MKCLDGPFEGEEIDTALNRRGDTIVLHDAKVDWDQIQHIPWSFEEKVVYQVEVEGLKFLRKYLSWYNPLSQEILSDEQYRSMGGKCEAYK